MPANALFNELALPEGVMDNRSTYIRQVRAGIPGRIVRQAVELLGSRDLLVRLLHTSSANLSRYYRKKTLTPGDSEEVLDALRVFFEAVRLWGDLDRAREWLNSPLPALDGDRPVDLFDTFEGRRWVSQVLRKIEHGEFS